MTGLRGSQARTSTSVRAQLLARADDDRPGLLFEDRSWSWAEVVRESVVRAAVLEDLLPEGRPPHVGVLLDNTPEFPFLLGAAALGGRVLVGLNPTRRGSALAADIARSDTQVVLTDATYAGLLADTNVRVVRLDSPEWADLLATHAGADHPVADVGPDTLMMLIFTSGTSGDPKAVNVTQAKVAHPGVFLSERFGLGPDDVAYLSMPMFHSNAIMAGWGPALASGATIALARRFSASGFLTDVRRYAATYANYVGKPLAYVLATPERPDDADNPLRTVFGNEANERDIAEFGRRFGCVVIDSYSSTENAVIVQRVPEMPPGSLGRPLDGVKVLDPESMAETPDAEFGPDGRLLNADRGHRRAGQHPGRGGVRRLLQRPRRGGRANARRHVLVRRPRLPRRRRLRLLRRAHRRLAPGRRREPRRRTRRADPAAAPERLRGGGVRRPRRAGRRPGDGRAGHHCTADPARARRLPRRPAGPVTQGLAPLRPGRGPAPPHRHQQGAQARAGGRRPGAGRWRALGRASRAAGPTPPTGRLTRRDHLRLPAASSSCTCRRPAGPR